MKEATMFTPEAALLPSATLYSEQVGFILDVEHQNCRDRKFTRSRCEDAP